MIFGHAGGFNWDEALVVFSPLFVAVLGVATVRSCARRVEPTAERDDERRG